MSAISGRAPPTAPGLLDRLIGGGPARVPCRRLGLRVLPIRYSAADLPRQAVPRVSSGRGLAPGIIAVGSRRGDPGVFAATPGLWLAHAPAGCRGAAGCGFGALQRRLCQRHSPGQPGSGPASQTTTSMTWLASVPPVVGSPQPGQAACRVQLLPVVGAPRARCCATTTTGSWKALGCPDLAGFSPASGRPPERPTVERADLADRPCPRSCGWR